MSRRAEVFWKGDLPVGGSNPKTVRVCGGFSPGKKFLKLVCIFVNFRVIFSFFITRIERIRIIRAPYFGDIIYFFNRYGRLYKLVTVPSCLPVGGQLAMSSGT